jgi:hypothetical protein
MTLNIECHYDKYRYAAECHDYLNVMLSDVMLSLIRLSVIKPSVVAPIILLRFATIFHYKNASGILQAKYNFELAFSLSINEIVPKI